MSRSSYYHYKRCYSLSVYFQRAKHFQRFTIGYWNFVNLAFRQLAKLPLAKVHKCIQHSKKEIFLHWSGLSPMVVSPIGEREDWRCYKKISLNKVTNMATLSELVLSQVDQSARGPTPFSHWVIPNRLLASAYPGEKNPEAHKIRTREIVDAGVQVVVNIMEIEELKNFTPYQDIMREYARAGNRDIEFISFPIRDQSVHADNQRVFEFCLELCDRIRKGQVVLVHCWGGHGRTGTIISIIIGILFNLSGEEALSMNSRLHDQRIRTNGVRSPETEVQKNQVRFVLDELYHKNKKKTF